MAASTIEQNRNPWDLAASTITVLQRVLVFLSGLSVVAMVILVFADATSRTVAETPVRGTLEIVSFFLLPVSVFGAYAYAHAQNQHISMTLFVDRLRGRAYTMNRILIEVATLISIILMFSFALRETIASVELGEANVSLITVPIWPAKIFMCIGLAAFALQSLLKLATSVHELLLHNGAPGKAEG